MGKADRDPWNIVEDVSERLDALRPDRRAAQAGIWEPAADVVENSDAFVFEVELPGLRRADIVIEVRGGELLVLGERRLEKDIRGSAFHVMERSHGPFVRRFAIPSGVDLSKVLAVYGDGLLTVTLPKKDKSLKRRVTIEIS